MAWDTESLSGVWLGTLKAVVWGMARDTESCCLGYGLDIAVARLDAGVSMVHAVYTEFRR